MNWRDELAEGFPEPRDDEPESLRQNIVDELADHLSCALVRELHFTTDEKTAIERVLDRFGDPRKIARRLWLDSMKEKLMSQRIALATSILAAAASIAACVMVYFVVNESREAIQILVEQGNTKNQAILDRLEKLASRPATTSNPEWNPAKLRLVQEKSGGSPAVGYKVSFYKAGNDNDEIRLEEKSDADGVVDLGLLRAGRYHLHIWTSVAETAYQEVYIRAGRPTDLEIICPTPEPAKTNVRFDFEWPADLRDKGFRMHTFFLRTSRTFNGRPWTIGIDKTRFQHLVFLPDSTFVDLTGEQQEGTLSELAQKLDAHVAEQPPQKQVTWDSGNYLLVGQASFGPHHRLKDSETGYSDIVTDYWGADFYQGYENVQIGADGYRKLSGGGFFSVPDSPRALLLTAQPAMQFGSGGGGFGNADDDFLPSPTFEVQPGVENVWKISLPEAVIESFRKQLADPKAFPVENDQNPNETPKQPEPLKVDPANPRGN